MISYIGSVVLTIAIVMVSVILHEVAHGYMAYRLGDPTAKRAGRLSLNPVRHLDPIGSVLLPIIMTLAGGPVFAYAKPVPYNPRNLRNPQRDEALVALAGPLANLAQALVGALLFWLLRNNTAAVYDFFVGMGAPDGAVMTLATVLYQYVYLNLTLMFFNLIPLPPLDGSKVISIFLTGEARSHYYRLQAYSMPILLVLLYGLPSFLGVDPVGAYLDVTTSTVLDLIMWV